MSPFLGGDTAKPFRVYVRTAASAAFFLCAFLSVSMCFYVFLCVSMCVPVSLYCRVCKLFSVFFCVVVFLLAGTARIEPPACWLWEHRNLFAFRISLLRFIHLDEACFPRCHGLFCLHHGFRTQSSWPHCSRNSLRFLQDYHYRRRRVRHYRQRVETEGTKPPHLRYDKWFCIIMTIFSP